LRNNRGINDGGDLPLEFMEDIYNRIVHNEIKMKVSGSTCNSPFAREPSLAATAALLDITCSKLNVLQLTLRSLLQVPSG